MNKKRRKQLDDIKRELKATINKLNTVLNDEEWAFDNMPENLQNSMRGMDAEDAISSMENAQEALNDAMIKIKSAIESLDEIL